MNNINPKFWGPPAWDFFYYITLSYPDNPTDHDKECMETFFKNINCVLPCKSCRDNHSRHMKKHPLNKNVLVNRYNLVNWLVRINNEVNISLGKKTVTYEQIINKYLNHENSFIYNLLTSKLIYAIIIFIIIVVLICIIKFKSSQRFDYRQYYSIS